MSSQGRSGKRKGKKKKRAARRAGGGDAIAVTSPKREVGEKGGANTGGEEERMEVESTQEIGAEGDQEVYSTQQPRWKRLCNGLKPAKYARKRRPRSMASRTHCQTMSMVGYRAANQAAGRFWRKVESQFSLKLMEVADKGFGLSKRLVMQKAADFCRVAKIEHLFKDGPAGESWYRGFTRRHPELSHRNPSKLCTNRGKVMGREVVAGYFRDLGALTDGVPPEKMRAGSSSSTTR
ncbi:tigger transposable element-derived protein 6 [Elysia marginata]|uniref:Tigger transposable element-derived protein 6 n=1 Tax=Elysia marginata TaxID=1093978 RepID=A0AAV4JGF8_9GAST|nr:tigger transposable element-derived protein 6 [Elysia marginata]